MLTTESMNNATGEARVRITRSTIVRGVGKVAPGDIVSIPANEARILLAQKQAEPAPEIQTRKKRASKTSG